MLPPDDRPFNVGITGAGASALSLAFHLRNIPSIDAITIIAPDLNPKDDKTWCFWDNDAVLNEALVYHSWNKLCVFTPDGTPIQGQMNNYRYQCVRSAHYQQYMLDILKKDSKITFIEDRVQSIDVPDDLEITARMGARILTENGTHFSDLVFQSHLRPDDSKVYSSDHIALKQHFLGWDIRCDADVFDPETAILMDFRVPQNMGFAFVYVLPFDKRTALAEITYFSAEVFPIEHYKKTLQSYLGEIWNCHLISEPQPLNTNAVNTTADSQSGSSESSKIVRFEIEREEYGVIPMADGVIKSVDDYPVYSIGMAGGHAKASTGYTFSRIHQDSRRIADALKTSSLPERISLSRPRYRFYDLLILNIIKKDPSQAVKIFTELFRKNGFDNMLAFLDENTRFSDDLRVMASVPSYLDFFVSMWQTRHRWRDVLKRL
jgi:lycopene beta-cyclase